MEIDSSLVSDDSAFMSERDDVNDEFNDRDSEFAPHGYSIS